MIKKERKENFPNKMAKMASLCRMANLISVWISLEDGAVGSKDREVTVPVTHVRVVIGKNLHIERDVIVQAGCAFLGHLDVGRPVVAKDDGIHLSVLRLVDDCNQPVLLHCLLHHVEHALMHAMGLHKDNPTLLRGAKVLETPLVHPLRLERRLGDDLKACGSLHVLPNVLSVDGEVILDKLDHGGWAGHLSLGHWHRVAVDDVLVRQAHEPLQHLPCSFNCKKIIEVLRGQSPFNEANLVRSVGTSPHRVQGHDCPVLAIDVLGLMRSNGCIHGKDRDNVLLVGNVGILVDHHF